MNKFLGNMLANYWGRNMRVIISEFHSLSRRLGLAKLAYTFNKKCDGWKLK